MKIFNSMTKKKEEFVPINGNNVTMYACGVTVYDLSHIGHARQAIVYSMMADYLRYKGYNVKYVRNYTDVDDKIIKRANEYGKNALEFSKEQIEETEKDMAGLHITEADVKTKASEYIDKIIEFVERLIEKGYAYKTEKGDVYYSVRKFKEYGKLSHRNVDDMLNGVRIELEEGKKDPIDFALWKSAKPGEIYWESPWGKGRPGWHIECSVMALDTLGQTIDIHGGGRDLLFPHHENEIAQSEALTGKKFANIWSHCGLIKINGEKMSKSLGNSLTIRDALKKYDYETIKYVMFSKHYGSDVDLSDNDYSLAENHLNYFYTSIKEMNKYIKDNLVKEYDVKDDIADSIIPKFVENMDEDFNTTASIANLYNIFKYANNIMKTSKDKTKEDIANILRNILKNVHEVYSVLGLFDQNPDEYITKLKNKYLKELDIDEENIKQEIEKRAKAKQNKDFEKADKIRNALEAKGIILKDSKEGTSWDFKSLYNG
ncbi:MAG TPA: cysteine--tRNA ligase [Clostridiaceae bacterium]|nr:cysteine--tRNA ligase [Clostridiaceae bacterium]